MLLSGLGKKVLLAFSKAGCMTAMNVKFKKTLSLSIGKGKPILLHGYLGSII